MSITNYNELQTAIADWLARPGDPTITAIAPDLIRLAETRINYGAGDTTDSLDATPFKSAALRARQMQTRATVSLTSEYMAVPDDFLEVISLKDNARPEIPLVLVSPYEFTESAASFTTGRPRVYTIIGDQFRFGPFAASETLELWYYAKVPALSEPNPTNWLLMLKPDIYLYAALLESVSFIGDDGRLPHWAAMYAGALRGVMAQDRKSRYGAAPLIMRPIGSTP